MVVLLGEPFRPRQLVALHGVHSVGDGGWRCDAEGLGFGRDRFSLGELLSERAGEGFALYGRHSNPRFVEILKIIGFDREWARADGAYLYDRDGTRFLDWLGGFGMFNVGRNNPTVRAALAELLDLETPSLPQLGLSDLPGLLAEALVRDRARLAPTASSSSTPAPRRSRRRSSSAGRRRAARESSRSRTASTG